MNRRDYGIAFNPALGSTAKSVFIGEGAMMRQRGKMLYVLYVLEIESRKDDTPIYTVPRVRADLPIR